MHNGRYAVLLERALAAYWDRAGGSYDPGHPRFGEVFFAVREFAITYHAPITRIGTVQVQLWLDHLGDTSAVYGFRVRSGDGTVVHAEGRRVQVRLDPATLRPARIGADMREAFRPLLSPLGMNVATSWLRAAARHCRGAARRPDLRAGWPVNQRSQEGAVCAGG